jgi:hypothetical protein
VAGLAGSMVDFFALPLALISTGAAAIARAATHGGVGWVVLGVVAFLAVCAAPWSMQTIH